MDAKDKISYVLKEIPPQVKLVAVSKTRPGSEILKFYNAGHKIFGENKVQEITSKYISLPKDIEWHFIGHLQRNKVKLIVPFVHLIHGVDSFRLLKEINNQAKKIDRIINCLLQFHIATEESKFGLDMEEARIMIESDEFKSLNHIRIKGVMGMATFTQEERIIREEFKNLKSILNELKKSCINLDDDFREISMGMSADYKIAIEEGSTIVRIGSAIFGARLVY
ncbi:MAG: YggS family pyridoxal phosphate-dependent enzyme [Bacteroidales bacterium]|nr:YggS family pyridoxal phosphate-dependent enzyme [Bacteroidales bacterium]